MGLGFPGWRRALETWGSAAAMLFCVVAGLATVGLLVHAEAVASFRMLGILESEQVQLGIRVVTLSAVAAAALPLYLPRFANAVRGAVLGLIAGLIAGIATGLFDRGSEHAYAFIVWGTVTIAAACLASAFVAWIAGAVLSRLARRFVAVRLALPLFLVVTVGLVLGLYVLWSQGWSAAVAWYRTDPSYRLVPSIWTGSMAFDQTYPFTLAIEQVEPDGRFTGFLDWSANLSAALSGSGRRVGIEGKATGNRLVFVDTKVLRGDGAIGGDRKEVWIDGTTMRGTDKNGRARLTARLVALEPPEVAEVLAPAAGQIDPPPVPDVPPEDIAALVTMAAVVPSEPARAPRAAVDARGWIDVWELRRDVAQVERMPRPNEHCSPEGDGSEPEAGKEPTPEELKRARKEEAAAKACEEENVRIEAALESAHQALNLVWLPALKNAMQKGDPVAEVILRTCVTTHALDRAGIETDCSRDPAQKEVARRRLEAIGFAPALNWLTLEDMNGTLYTSHHPKPARPWKGQGPYSNLPVVALYELTIARMEKGDLTKGAGTLGGYHCSSYSNAPPFDRCNYLHHMSERIRRHARWFFLADGYPLPGLLPLSLVPPEAPVTFPGAEPPRPLENLFIKNPEGFRAELAKRLKIVDASVAAYLRKDPRWAVFLMERGEDSVRFAVRPR